MLIGDGTGGRDTVGRGVPLDAAAVAFLGGGFLLSTRAVSWNVKAVATLLLLGYLAVSYFADGEDGAAGRGRTVWVKLALLVSLVGCLAVTPTISSILARHAQGPHTNAHDGVLQVEAAMRFVLDGKNPYAEEYTDTPLGRWGWRAPYPNPALYYLAYLPFMFLGGMPLWALSEATLGWYDQRFAYLLAFGVAMWAWQRLARDRVSGLAALAVVALNPLSLPYFIEGRNDVVVLALLGLSLWALGRGGVWGLGLSGALFGLACATKQSVWFLGPFLLLYVWGRVRASRQQGPPGESVRLVARRWVLPGAVVALGLVLPFLVWDPASFREDTVSYLSGNVEHNYPIKRAGAYGFHVLLSSPGFARGLDALTSGPLGFLRPVADALKVTDERQAYPFWVFQALFALPVMALALRRQMRRNTLSGALAGYAVTLLVWQYFSRFLHDNYIGFLVSVWALAYLARDPLEGEEGESASVARGVEAGGGAPGDLVGRPYGEG